MKQQQHDTEFMDMESSEKIRVPYGFWIYDPPWSSRMF